MTCLWSWHGGTAGYILGNHSHTVEHLNFFSWGMCRRISDLKTNSLNVPIMNIRFLYINVTVSNVRCLLCYIMLHVYDHCRKLWRRCHLECLTTDFKDFISIKPVVYHFVKLFDQLPLLNFICNCKWFSPSVLWHCWLGGRKGIRPVQN